MLWTIRGAVRYSHVCMPATLAPWWDGVMSTDEPDVLTRSARPPDRTVVTGPEQTVVYDVWEPPADRAPRGLTVALVHGGFWREQYDRHHLPPLAAALAADGFHVSEETQP